MTRKGARMLCRIQSFRPETSSRSIPCLPLYIRFLLSVHWGNHHLGRTRLHPAARHPFSGGLAPGARFTSQNRQGIAAVIDGQPASEACEEVKHVSDD